MEIKVKIIDNLFDKNKIPSKIEYFIYNTIIKSLTKTNENKEYTESDISNMISYRSPKKTFITLKESYFCYIENDENEIIAFSSIYEKNGKYYFSWLQVLPEYQNLGLASILTNFRKNILKNKNIDIVYIESLTFKKTILYHLKHNFIFTGDQSGLTVAVRMFCLL